MTTTRQFIGLPKHVGWGCLSEDCDTVEASCPAITRHMQAEHPDLGITDCPGGCPEASAPLVAAREGGQMPGQSRLGGAGFEPVIDEAFMLTATAPTPRTSAPVTSTDVPLFSLGE